MCACVSMSVRVSACVCVHIRVCKFACMHVFCGAPIHIHEILVGQVHRS